MLQKIMAAAGVSLACLMAVPCWAGVEHGNGGGSVVCRAADGSITSVELLDFYEQRQLLNLTRDMGPAGTSYKDKIHYVLDRHADLAPYRAKSWGEQADNFESEAVFLSGVVFDQLHDTGDIFIPSACTFEQVVVQQEPTLPRDKRFKVNKDLWDRLDDENKAGLVLHEVIYREAITYGHTDSIATRYVNGLWSAAGVIPEFADMRQTNEMLAQAHFLVGEAYGCNPALYAFVRGNSDKLIPDWNKRQILRHYPNGRISMVGRSVFPAVVTLPTPLGDVAATCPRDNSSDDFALLFRQDGSLSWAYISGNFSGPGWNLQLEDAFYDSDPDYHAVTIRSGNSFKVNFSGSVNIQGQQIAFPEALGEINGIEIDSLSHQLHRLVATTGSNFKLLGVNGKWFANFGSRSFHLTFDEGVFQTCLIGCVITDN